MIRLGPAAIAALALPLVGCFEMRDSSGGGQTVFHGARVSRADDVALASGCRIEVVVSGLTTGLMEDG